jgi:hypothetical protein
MIKFIFEDSDNTPSSKLLKSCYNGDNISFSNGGKASKIFRLIKRYKELDASCTIIVYFDLPPNNKFVYTNYELLIDFIDDENFDKVYVVPIICIEYYIIKFLVINNYVKLKETDIGLINNLINNFDYSDVIVKDFIESSSYNSKSLEHVYKSLLSRLASRQRCLRNSFNYLESGIIDDSSLLGKFYIMDCCCERKYCKPNCTGYLSDKAERLYIELPIFDVIDNNHAVILHNLGIVFKSKDLESLFNDVILFFNSISESMGIEVPYIYDLT